MLQVDILFLELIIDPACSIVFESEAEEKDIMERPPRKREERLFTQRTLAICLLQGSVVLAIVFGVYAAALLAGSSKTKQETPMTAAACSLDDPSPQEYKRRIWAWAMYDWANSAFATTILAAVLPVYFSQVAGATLPSATVATTYWSTGLSLSLFIIAVIAPVLGTISDLMRGKKRFLSLFAGIGIVSTSLLGLGGTGDWILASILGIIGRIGFSGANTFYDALLPHVAKEEDRDLVSARGYAMGYLGGGLLLAINIGCGG